MGWFIILMVFFGFLFSGITFTISGSKTTAPSPSPILAAPPTTPPAPVVP